MRLDNLEVYAKVHTITDDEVMMDCNIGEDGKGGYHYENRSFRRSPMFDGFDMKEGMFMKVKVTTEPGVSKCEIEPVEEDLEHLFFVDFESLRDSDFWKKIDDGETNFSGFTF